MSIIKLDLFEFVKILLTDKIKYAQCTDALKRSHFFMTQRMLAKAYPIQVQAANLNGIDDVAILNTYHTLLCKHGSGVPKWLYTKSQNAKTDKASELYENIIKNQHLHDLLVYNVFNIEHKSLRHLIDIDYQFVFDEYKKLNDVLTNKTIKEKNKAN